MCQKGERTDLDGLGHDSGRDNPRRLGSRLRTGLRRQHLRHPKDVSGRLGGDVIRASACITRRADAPEAAPVEGNSVGVLQRERACKCTPAGRRTAAALLKRPLQGAEHTPGPRQGRLGRQPSLPHSPCPLVCWRHAGQGVSLPIWTTAATLMRALSTQGPHCLEFSDPPHVTAALTRSC